MRDWKKILPNSSHLLRLSSNGKNIGRQPESVGGKLRQIRQHFATDCFPTCIAMVAGISWRQAIQLVHPIRIKGWGYGTHDYRAVQVLRLLGFKIRKRYIKDFTKLKDVAILAHTHERGEHVAVWDPVQQRVIDPSPRRKGQTNSWYKKRINHVLIITR